MKKQLLMLCCITCSLAYAQETIYGYIQNENDDAYEIYNYATPHGGNMFVDSSMLKMGVVLDEGRAYNTGLRFHSVAIPPGSTIVSAFVQFTSYGTNPDTIPLQIYGELNPNPLPFTNVAFNILDRERGDEYIIWSARDWAGFINGPNMRTTNINTIVQEIIDMDGWEENNPLAIVFLGYNWGGIFQYPKYACSREFSGELYAPVLEVTFYPPAGINESPMAKNIHIYPNPVKDHFMVWYVKLQQGEYAIQVINLYANAVYEIPHLDHREGDLKLNLSAKQMDLSAGIYTLRLIGNNGQVNRKIIIQ